MSTLFSHFFQKFNQISPLETHFTEVLDSIVLKPKTLYFYGKIPENMSNTATSEKIEQHEDTETSTQKNRTSSFRPKAVAIVGSRHNTHYGEDVAYRLAYELAKRGVVVISGLAYGIDSIAHRGALAANGKTIAILGTRINEIYPKAHLSLAQEIIEKDGAIISEYAPDAKIYPKYSFLERNRLISGLSDAVVVVEAAERSGSLNTAAHALEQGKEVFAVPGNITNPYSQGCNKLIKQGATPYTDPSDVLEFLFPEECLKKRQKLRQANLFGDTDVETSILQAIARGLYSGEDIMNATHLPPEVFNEAVTLLEIKSRIRSLGANRWSLVS